MTESTHSPLDSAQSSALDALYAQASEAAAPAPPPALSALILHAAAQAAAARLSAAQAAAVPALSPAPDPTLATTAMAAAQWLARGLRQAIARLNEALAMPTVRYGLPAMMVAVVGFQVAIPDGPKRYQDASPPAQTEGAAKASAAPPKGAASAPPSRAQEASALPAQSASVQAQSARGSDALTAPATYATPTAPAKDRAQFDAPKSADSNTKAKSESASQPMAALKNDAAGQLGSAPAATNSAAPPYAAAAPKPFPHAAMGADAPKTPEAKMGASSRQTGSVAISVTGSATEDKKLPPTITATQDASAAPPAAARQSAPVAAAAPAPAAPSTMARPAMPAPVASAALEPAPSIAPPSASVRQSAPAAASIALPAPAPAGTARKSASAIARANGAFADEMANPSLQLRGLILISDAIGAAPSVCQPNPPAVAQLKAALAAGADPSFKPATPSNAISTLAAAQRCGFTEAAAAMQAR